RVPQVLDHADGCDVEITGHQPIAEPIRGVAPQIDVEQGTRVDQPPIDRQAVQELNVTDSRPRHGHASSSSLAALASDRSRRRTWEACSCADIASRWLVSNT